MSELLQPLESRLHLSAGQIDPYFGNEGTVQINSGNAVVMSDGRLIVAHHNPHPFRKPNGIEFSRLNTDGQIDRAFHPLIDAWDGPRGGRFFANAREVPVIAIDARDRIFAVLEGRIYCLLQTGKLDPSFGTNGSAALPLNRDVFDLHVDRAGRIVIAGSGWTHNGQHGEVVYAAIARLRADGALDRSFGDAGVWRASGFVDPGIGDPLGEGHFTGVRDEIHIQQIVEDSQGRLLGVRTHLTTDDRTEPLPTWQRNSLIMRFGSNGKSDRSFPQVRGRTWYHTDSRFATGASQAPEFPERTVSLHSIHVGAGDRLIVGLNDAATDEHWSGILRLNSDGTRDPSFGDNGYVDDFPGNDFPVIDQMRLMPDGSVYLVAHDRLRALYRVTANGTADEVFGQVPVAERTQVAQILPASDGTLYTREAFWNHRDHIGERIIRRWAHDGPVATLAARPILVATSGSQVLDVKYRDDVGVDVSTFDRRDLRITGPNGFVAYAKFDRVLSTTNNDGLVTARYKLAAPGGSWNAADNGNYAVQLVGAQVRDTDGHAAQGRVLVSFRVHIGGTSAPQSLGLRMTFSSTPNNDGSDEDQLGSGVEHNSSYGWDSL